MNYRTILTGVLTSSISILGLVSCKSKVSNSDVKEISSSVQVSPSTKFDIIDSSFLFPFPDKDGFSLKASRDTGNFFGTPVESTLFSERQFANLPLEFRDHLNGTATRSPGTAALDSLYITAFRYDPCFPIVTPGLDPNGPGCQARAIRLVGQFIDFDTGKASAASMHILFITKSPDPARDVQINNGIINSLKGLKKISAGNTAGIPLGVHPGFSGPNKEQFQQTVKGIILKFCSQANFFATSIFFKSRQNSSDNKTTWNWAQLRNKPTSDMANGNISIDKTTGVKSDVDLDFGQFTLAADGSGNTNPGIGKFRDKQIPGQKLFFPIPPIHGLLKPGASAREIITSMVAADVYENPTMMTIPAGDCASCHLVTQRKLNALENKDLPFNRSRQFHPPDGITGTMDPEILARMKTIATGDPKNAIVINLGYHGSVPVVSQRTVNEAVKVTHLINESMLDKNPWDGLETDINFIKADAAGTVVAMTSVLGKPASRHFHPKGFCAKGEFTIANNIPPAGQVGLFAKAGKYPMYGRFSNGIPVRTIKDSIPSVFGFGIKVVGVEGKKFAMPGSSKPVNSNQDWNLGTGRIFPIPSAHVYRLQREFSKQQDAGRRAPDDPEVKDLMAKARQKLLAADPGVLDRLEDARSLLDAFTLASYHSQVALHFGEKSVAKFSVAPCEGGDVRIGQSAADSRPDDYLREGLKKEIMSGNVCFKFRAQIRPADNLLPEKNKDWADKYPDDNPTLEWLESDIPFTTLATIKFPKPTDIDTTQETCKNFSINPGNTLQAFRPIESDTLMMSRFRGAYEGSVTTRNKLNNIDQQKQEPKN